jgi:hypothetical protein
MGCVKYGYTTAHQSELSDGERCAAKTAQLELVKGGCGNNAEGDLANSRSATGTETVRRIECGADRTTVYFSYSKPAA